MMRSRWRLVVSAVLFVGWIGYLGWVVANSTRPVILSRPQFLTADLYVVATVTAQGGGEPADVVTVKECKWAAVAADGKRQQLKVRNLPKCVTALGWEGPGDYVLALSHTKDGPDLFEVTPLPKTPGFPGWSPERYERGETLPGRKDPPRLIYKATDPVLRQLDELVVEFHQ
jgi:hypothetical protein